MNIFSVSFGKSRVNDYTPYQKKIMKDMKKAALTNGWCDIYTGDVFSKTNLPTIEHLIPHSKKGSKEIQEMSKKGFQIDGLDNIFPVGSLGNSIRGSDSFAKSVTADPKILDRLLEEMEKYKKYNSEFIKGDNWVQRLQKTILSQLQGLSSDIKTKLLI